MDHNRPWLPFRHPGPCGPRGTLICFLFLSLISACNASFTKALEDLKSLSEELRRNSGTNRIDYPTLTVALLSVLIALVIVALCVCFCCVIPFIRRHMVPATYQPSTFVFHQSTQTEAA